MDRRVIELLYEQLHALKVGELKKICKHFKTKPGIKYSNLKKEFIIKEILQYMDFSSVLSPSEKHCLILSKINRIVQTTCEKRLRGENTEWEKKEYLRLKNLLNTS
jgi:hypothetical protein